MTSHEKILKLFKANGNTLTLGQLLSDPSGVGYKSTSRFSELRKKGFTILCKKAKKASDNQYHLIPPSSDGKLAFY